MKRQVGIVCDECGGSFLVVPMEKRLVTPTCSSCGSYLCDSCAATHSRKMILKTKYSTFSGTVCRKIVVDFRLDGAAVFMTWDFADDCVIKCPACHYFSWEKVAEIWASRYQYFCSRCRDDRCSPCFEHFKGRWVHSDHICPPPVICGTCEELVSPCARAHICVLRCTGAGFHPRVAYAFKRSLAKTALLLLCWHRFGMLPTLCGDKPVSAVLDRNVILQIIERL